MRQGPCKKRPPNYKEALGFRVRAPKLRKSEESKCSATSRTAAKQTVPKPVTGSIKRAPQRPSLGKKTNGGVGPLVPSPPSGTASRTDRLKSKLACAPRHGKFTGKPEPGADLHRSNQATSLFKLRNRPPH